MSRLEELIQELCPDGVEYKKISDITDVERGVRVVRKNLSEEDGYPVYQNSLLPLGFHTSFNRSHDTVFIISAGAAGDIGYSDKDFWAADDCLFIKECDELNQRFLYHVLLSKQNIIYGNVRKASIPRLARTVIERLEIPVPPLEVQREIVRILDQFTLLRQELSDQLSAELSARKKQYEYYSQELLVNKVTDYVPISDLGKWMGGKTPSMDNSDYWTNGVIPWISSKDMKTAVLSDTQDHITREAISGAAMKMFPAGSVAIVTRSGILKHTFPVVYVPFETTINQDIKALVPAQNVSGRYVSLVMQAFSEDIRKKTKKQGGTVDSLDFQKVLEYKIPLPPYDEQLALVEKLEAFDKHINNLSEGLPAEIEARTKQYEYYTDKLLSFKRKELL